jgi:hypothetical protein
MKENSMRNNILAALLLAFAVSAFAANKIQPLNARLGLWEVTTTITSQGAMPIPAEFLARLTPEQRAKVEERMKANSAGTTKTTTHKKCMTKEKEEKAETFTDDDNKSCTVTVLTSTSTKLEMKRVCKGEALSGEGTIHVEAPSPESVKGTTHAVMTGNNNTMHIDGTFTGKWIGSACGETR